MGRPLPTSAVDPYKKFHFFSLAKEGSLERRNEERKKGK
jgi:hypothetical protein